MSKAPAQDRNSRISKYAVPILVVGIAISTLIGWATNTPILFRFVKSFPAINPLTAILFVLSGMGLALVQSEYRHKTIKIVVMTITGMVFVVAIVHIIDNLTGYKLTLDQIIFRENILKNAPPISRNSIATATSFIFFSIALFISYICDNNRKRVYIQTALLPVLIISLVSLLVYTTGAAFFVSTKFFFGLSMHTIILFLLLSLGLSVHLKNVRQHKIYYFDQRFIGVSLLVFAIAWYLKVSPIVLGIGQNFEYEAQIRSIDNFYNSEENTYSGEILSDTKFYYKTQKSINNNIEIQNVFDVKKPSGEPIFSVERLYLVDSRTGKHVNTGKESDRTGYLFAPRNNDKEPYTYWHVNYNQPLIMGFEREEKILGLNTYVFNTKFTADQTKDLTNLETVGETTGIELEVDLTVWVEPKTGHLIKYEDYATAYYYDLDTKERIRPWNKFHNEYKTPSITEHVIVAERAKIVESVVHRIVPITFVALGLVLLGTYYFSKKYPKLSRRMLPATVALIAFIVTVLIGYGVKTTIKLYTEVKFERDATELKETVLESLTDYAYTLLGGKGLINASDEVTREEWRRYAEGLELSKNFPGVQGFGYSIVVKPEDLNNHIAKVRSEGFPDYTIHPEGEREIYTSIVYLEPLDVRNIQAFGFDMYQESIRRAAMNKAIEMGEPTMSGKTTLVQEIDDDIQLGFLIYVPIYKKGVNISTIGERRNNIVGFVYSPFRANNTFKEIISHLDYPINLSIYDTTNIEEISSENAIFKGQFRDRIDSQKEFGQYTNYEVINFLNKDFLIKYDSMPEFSLSFADKFVPTVVMFAGALISMLLFFVINSAVKERELAEKIAEDMTKESTKFKLAVEAASDQIVITDANGIILYANQALKEITGFEVKDILGKKAGAPDLWGGQMPHEFYEHMWKTLKVKKQVFSGEIKNKRIDGSEYNAKVNISPVLDSNKEVEFFVAIERDITKEKEIDQAKTEFVSLASHQLRTPLAAISWYTEILMGEDSGTLNEEQKGYLEVIEQSSDKMTQLVKALLNVSRLELGTFAVDPEPTELGKVFEAVYKELEPVIKQKEIEYRKEIEVSEKVNVDKSLIEIIIQNLISNAVKYTPEKGKIWAKLYKTDGNIVIEIKDTGYGIPTENQDKIFTKLYRADNITNIETEGTGLGLYIVKSIIDKTGGSIWFDSDLNKGTTFYIKYPAKGMEEKDGPRKIESITSLS